MIVSSSKRALITGIIGQDGSCMAELLLDRGYEVTSCFRRTLRRGSAAVTISIGTHIFEAMLEGKSVWYVGQAISQSAKTSGIPLEEGPRVIASLPPSS